MDKAVNKPIKVLKVDKLLKHFNNKIIYRGKLSANEISSPVFNRAGLELANANQKAQASFDDIHSTVIWGTVESKYLKSLNNINSVKSAIRDVLKLNPPLIMLCDGFDFTKEVLSVAKAVKTVTTIVTVKERSHDLYYQLSGWLTEKLANYEYVHATVVEVNGIGVLISGESGVGKSEAALELIKNGALFVADDAVEVTNLGNRLFARPSALTEGFMEVRGIGMINIARAIGINNVKFESTQIRMVVELQRAPGNNVNNLSFERLHAVQETKNMFGVNLPFYHIPVTSGRDIASMIESAVTDLKLRKAGYNSAIEFDRNLKKISKEK